MAAHRRGDSWCRAEGCCRCAIYSVRAVCVVGLVLFRMGIAVVCAGFFGGLAVAVYAVGSGLHELSQGDLSGGSDVVKHLILYPLGAAMAGGFGAMSGMVMIALGESALDRRQAKTEGRADTPGQPT